jgi:Tfp pilus assembly protein PilZ
VSEAGACLYLPERLSPGTTLDLMLRGEAAHYMFHADVVWAGPAGSSPIPHGVRLEPASSPDRLAWERLLFEQRQRGSERAGRIVVDLPARCLVDGDADPLPGDVQNLGAGGLLLRLPELLPVGTGATVTILSPLRSLQLGGRVAWSQARPGELPAHGVAFTDPAAGREALHQVVLAEFLLRAGRSESASPH